MVRVEKSQMKSGKSYQQKRGMSMNRLFRKFVGTGLAAVVLSTAALPASAASVSDFKDVSPNAW